LAGPLPDLREPAPALLLELGRLIPLGFAAFVERFAAFFAFFLADLSLLRAGLFLALLSLLSLLSLLWLVIGFALTALSVMSGKSAQSERVNKRLIFSTPLRIGLFEPR
jgi:hypothetical protein